MTRFSVSVEVAAPATRVWAELVDWPRHGDWVPLTVVRVTTANAGGVGAGFVARTGIGPLAFDDPMTVTRWQPPAGNSPGDTPGRCDVEKHGRLIHGTAWFEVTPLPGGHARATWHEDVTVTPHALTRHASPLLSAIGRIGFAHTLRAMARAAEQG
ncbi:SRPBCC family protein [Actinoplanes sp. NPDC051494]|uniref:SRPBCC family protein n=1 Tax=Actinoplanes sp. NPDC051494 TaxID=3363907 RepID=UPI0037A359B0